MDRTREVRERERAELVRDEVRERRRRFMRRKDEEKALTSTDLEDLEWSNNRAIAD